jgi:UDP-2-acetamido-3-amino-2,3-dideoxy-glucuronate N-acetyltransferase
VTIEVRSGLRTHRVIDDTGGVYHVHHTADVESRTAISAGTTIWRHTTVGFGARIGANCTIGEGVHIGPNVVVGNGCKIQNGAQLFEGVELEDDVFVGPHVVFTNVRYPRAHVPRRDQFEKTLVKRGASIGANVTVLCGRTIGEYAFVGAGTVVTHAIGPHQIYIAGRNAGWVCRCGEPLKPVVCPACKASYVMNGSGTLEGKER